MNKGHGAVGPDLWRVTYIEPPPRWEWHAAIYLEREDGKTWSELAARYRRSKEAIRKSHRTVAQHLEKLAETGGMLTPETRLSRCPGVRRQVYRALELYDVFTLGDAAALREDVWKRVPNIGKVGREEVCHLLSLAGLAEATSRVRNI